jgi:hypothetical protein
LKISQFSVLNFQFSIKKEVISWPVGNAKNADIHWKLILRLKNVRPARKNANFSITPVIPLIVR